MIQSIGGIDAQFNLEVVVVRQRDERLVDVVVAMFIIGDDGGNTCARAEANQAMECKE